MNQTHHVKTDLVIGLDVQNADQALECVGALSGFDCLFQVGPELFVNDGPGLLKELAHQNKRVFLDLKFLDSPRIVARAVQQAALLHAEMLTLNLGGGSGMIRAVKQALEEIPLLRPRLLGVGILPCFDDVKWAEISKAYSGHASDLGDAFEWFLNASFSWGLDGLVCSLPQLEQTRSLYPNLYTLVALSHLSQESFVASLQECRKFGADAVLLPFSLILAGYARTEVPAVLGTLGFTQSQV